MRWPMHILDWAIQAALDYGQALMPIDWLGAAERLEVVTEAAQPDRVEGQPGHVLRDVDGVGTGGLVPLGDQRPGDVEHRRVVAAHGAQREYLEAAGVG